MIGVVCILALLIAWAALVYPQIVGRAIDRALRFVFRYRDIVKPEGLYLRRFFLTPVARWWWPFRPWFLHRILLSDDRVSHDHPGGFTTIILAGEYVEHVFQPPFVAEVLRRRCPAGTVLRNAGTHAHYVEIVRPVWSLVHGWKADREWGFWPRRGDEPFTHFVPWRVYLGLDNAPTEREDAFRGDPKTGTRAAFITMLTRSLTPGTTIDPPRWPFNLCKNCRRHASSMPCPENSK